MSATIHYLRPFAREALKESETEAKTAPAASTAEGNAERGADMGAQDAGQDEPGGKRQPRRRMPFGRDSRFKKRMDGKVVPREPK